MSAYGWALFALGGAVYLFVLSKLTAYTSKWMRADERGYIAKRLVEEFGGGSAGCNCKADVAQIAEWIRKGEM